MQVYQGRVDSSSKDSVHVYQVTVCRSSKGSIHVYQRMLKGQCRSTQGQWAVRRSTKEQSIGLQYQRTVLLSWDQLTACPCNNLPDGYWSVCRSVACRVEFYRYIIRQ